MSLRRPVQQYDPKGCGVAAVAMVTRGSYERVRQRALQAGHWRPSYGMNGGMLRRMLKLLRRPVQSITMGRKAGNGRVAIVKASACVPVTVWRKGKAEKRNRQWSHWVVWVDGKVWDPGYGVWWDGNGAIDSMKLYLASVRTHALPVRVTCVRTGRWHWL